MKGSKSPGSKAWAAIDDIDQKLINFIGRFKNNQEASQVLRMCVLHRLNRSAINPAYDYQIKQLIDQFEHNQPPFMNEHGLQLIRKHILKLWQSIEYLLEFEDDVPLLLDIVNEQIEQAFNKAERVIRPYIRWIKQNDYKLTTEPMDAIDAVDIDKAAEYGQLKRVYEEFAEIADQFELMLMTKRLRV